MTPALILDDLARKGKVLRQRSISRLGQSTGLSRGGRALVIEELETSTSPEGLRAGYVEVSVVVVENEASVARAAVREEQVSGSCGGLVLVTAYRGIGDDLGAGGEQKRASRASGVRDVIQCLQTIKVINDRDKCPARRVDAKTLAVSHAEAV